MGFGSGAFARALALGVSLVTATSAAALVLLSGDGAGNTEPPPDDPGWDHVGTISKLTAVYLGRGWVMTARHASPGPETAFVLGETPHAIEPDSQVDFDTEPGRRADLVVFRLVAPPPLPTLRIAERAPALGDEVVVIGNGWARGPRRLWWDGSWSEVPQPAATRSGFARGGPSRLRWGRNVVSRSDVLVDLSRMQTRAFEMRFDDVGALPDECLGVSGDSGAAVFARREAGWELTGIVFALDRHAGQPGHLAAFGNVSSAVDLAFYRDDILSVVAPPISARKVANILVVVAAVAVAGGIALGVAASRRRPGSRADPPG